MSLEKCFCGPPPLHLSPWKDMGGKKLEAAAGSIPLPLRHFSVEGTRNRYKRQRLGRPDIHDFPLSYIHRPITRHTHK
jgi:hypothetical protein